MSSPNNNKDQLLDILYKLYKRLAQHDNSDMTNPLLERYNYFSNHSDHGRECKYALKCKHLFYLKDYQNVRDLIREATDIINKLEAGLT